MAEDTECLGRQMTSYQPVPVSSDRQMFDNYSHHRWKGLYQDTFSWGAISL